MTIEGGTQIQSIRAHINLPASSVCFCSEKEKIVAVNGTSRYAQYMNSRGREIFGGEIDVELADMCRAAAKKLDVKTSVWFRGVLADAVNAANLQREGRAWTYTPAAPTKQTVTALQQRIAELEAKLAQQEEIDA